MADQLPENPTADQVKAYFANDKFSTQCCGCRVVAAEVGKAVCEFDIKETHRNAQGEVMGGATFTLADFTLGIASNINEKPTVSVTNTIEYLNRAKGTKLIATATVDKSGKSLGYYSVDVVDDLGTAVAKMTATCFRRA